MTAITPKDYRSLSPEELAEWIDAGVKANQDRTGIGDSYWQPQTEQERLLTAIVSGIAEDSAHNFGLIFGLSKNKLISYIPRPKWIEISRYALTDWDVAFDATMQVVAERITGGHRRNAIEWRNAVKALGASTQLHKLVVRDPVGEYGSMVTPYGPLDYTIGKTQLHTDDGISGVVIAANREILTIEAKDGSIHRFRAERLHPDSGKLNRVIGRTKTRKGQTVHLGKSNVVNVKDGKRYYAIEWISPYRVMALAKDGSRLSPKATELSR